MTTWKCNSCGGQYQDSQPNGGAYFHVCPAEKITAHSAWNQGPLVSAAVIVAGVTVTPAVYGAPVLVTPEARAPIDNPRNENPPSNLVYVEGKPKLVTRDPNDATRTNYTDAPSLIIADGAGRTLVAA